MSKPAIFLDRDGVIIENRDAYVRSWADVEIFEQAIETVVALQPLPYHIVIVTNQSAVGRGIISLAQAVGINDRLVEIIHNRGGRIDKVYICPHSPAAGCDCRKPKPGMLLTAAQELDIDLAESIMIGDALTDLEAGIQAGVKDTILLATGRGSVQAALPQAEKYSSSLRFPDLTAAIGHYFEDELFLNVKNI